MKIHTQTFIILSLSIALLTGCSHDEKQNRKNKETPISVKVAVANQSDTDNIHASGKIESDETALISTRMMGVITNIPVKTGEVVKKGQLLVTINNNDILAKRAQAQAMVSEAEAALKDAQKDYERFEELYKQQSASTKEFENITLHYNSVKAKTEAARQMLAETDAMLSYTNLKAPFDGVITQKNSDIGSMANPGQPILVMERSGNFNVIASVTESDIVKIKTGIETEVIVTSTGKTIKGRISEISPSSQFSGGQYQIKINIPDNEKKGLYAGMYVNVQIPVEATAHNSLFIPRQAIIYKDQLSGLFTITDNQTALLRWVKLGKTEGNQVEVLSGLRDDEKFILESEGRLYNGARISIQ